MPTITHFMVPADDMERAKKFYVKLFDWKIEKFPGPIDYYAITTTNEKGEESLGGGLGKREEPQEAIVNYVDVPSVDEYMLSPWEIYTVNPLVRVRFNISLS
jgi:predicted enzyme related to lactoylglutathione lyase